MALLKLTISKVDGPVFDGEVESVTLPGLGGQLTLMANHQPLICPLTLGTITVRQEKGEDMTFEVENGTLEVAHNHASVLI